MQKITRKLLLSVSILILLIGTVAATTYAWVGFYKYGIFEQFEINVEASNTNDYGIEISLTGEKNTFGPSIEGIDLKKSILINLGYKESQLNSEAEIIRLFNRINLEQCSVEPQNNELKDFYDRENKITNKYFKFDLYISAYKTDGSTDDSDFNLDVYLSDGILTGFKDKSRLTNNVSYPSDYIYPLLPGETINNAKPGKEFSDLVATNSSYATRLALQKYEVVEKFDTITETNASDLIIYHVGSEEPIYEQESDCYSFGGILPTQKNFAHMAYNSTLNSWHRYDVPEWAINRGDVLYKDNGIANHVINSNVESEKVGISNMMKITIYFWFEGWDSDCFAAIDSNPVTINLNFSINDKKY